MTYRFFPNVSAAPDPAAHLDPAATNPSPKGYYQGDTPKKELARVNRNATNATDWMMDFQCRQRPRLF